LPGEILGSGGSKRRKGRILLMQESLYESARGVTGELTPLPMT
jgi:hypothetical protein